MPQIDLNKDFEQLMKESINPFFKQIGFKKKTLNFAKPINDIVQVFNVQKSQWNSYHDDLSFTFNAGFYSDLLYLESWDRKETTDFPKHYDCQIQFRLGFLSHERDHWYKLSPRIDFKNVCASVENDLNKFLVPLFDKYQTLDSLSGLIGKYDWIDNVIGPYNKISILWHVGQKDKAKQELQLAYKKALIPIPSISEINYPNGKKEVKQSEPRINQSFIDNLERLAKLYDIKIEK